MLKIKSAISGSFALETIILLAYLLINLIISKRAINIIIENIRVGK